MAGLTPEERRRIRQRQRELRQRTYEARIEKRPQSRVARVPAAALVALALAALAAVGWTVGGNLSVAVPADLAGTFLPAAR